MRLVRFFLLLGMVAVLGCGSGGPVPPSAEAEAETLKNDMTMILEDVAKTGDLEEAGPELRMMVDEQLREADAAKADSISKELDALEALSAPGEIKAKAKEIITKL